MTTDPDQIRTQIAGLLATLPALDAVDGDIEGGIEGVVEAVALRLEEAHDLLVRALESVER